MIILNGNKFAESDSEFVDSLFESGGTCSGYAKRNKKSVTIMNMRKEKVGLINAHGVLGSATKQPDGKWWYSYADIPEVGKYASYMQQVEECKAALSQTNIGAA